MINEKGKRVPGPKVPDIPPHMLEGMTSAGQKRVLRSWKRSESGAPAKKAAAKKTSAKKAPAKKSSQRKRSAKKAATANVPVTETKE